MNMSSPSLVHRALFVVLFFSFHVASPPFVALFEGDHQRSSCCAVAAPDRPTSKVLRTRKAWGMDADSLSIHGDARRREHQQRPREEQTFRPLIGVLSQGGAPAPEGYSYIAASYVKFIEAAGARAVPILHDMDRKEIERRFRAVNGIILPGGAQSLRPGEKYYDAASLIFNLTLQANDDGDFFPLHGTCLGFEALAILAAGGDDSVLAHFDAEDFAQPLYPTEKAEKSRFFSSLPPRVVHNLYTKPYAMQNHEHGISFQAFSRVQRLQDFFDVLTLSIDREDKVYVSTMEAKKYPISGTQWHPEKNAFEWTPDQHIPHNPEAIEITQEVANFIVGASRYNSHAPRSRKEEEDLIIYNFNEGLRYTGKQTFEGEEVSFDEVYVFPDAKSFLKS